MLILVCIIGIAVGIVHRQRAERPLTIMVAALGVILLVSVASLVVERVLYGLFATARGGGGIIDTLHNLWNMLAAFLQAAATAGLIFAVLCDRGFDMLNLSSARK